jgi:hypothetical protein
MSKIKKLFGNFRQSYGGVFGIFTQYWRAYGGLQAILLSPYFHVALILGMVCYPYKKVDDWNWWDIPIETIPSVIGFSLGGYAIFLGLGDEKFKSILGGNDETNKGRPSPFISLNTAFLHFIIIQLLALVLAVIGKSLGIQIAVYGVPSFIAFFYALLLAAAATIELYRVACWYDTHIDYEKRSP